MTTATSTSTATTVEVERVLSLRDAIELTGLSRDELQRHPRPVPRHGKRVSLPRPGDAEAQPRRAATASASTSTHPTTPERTPS